MPKKPSRQATTAQNKHLTAPETLFDRLDDIVFFIKDGQGRYSAVNETLVRRLGRAKKAEVLGRTAAELFPPHLAERIDAQDLDVLSAGRMIENELELHLYPDGQQGWCLTSKQPLRDERGRIIGLTGISRDLKPFSVPQGDVERVSAMLDYIRRHIDQPLPMAELSAHAGLSIWQLDQRVRSLLGLSLAQHVLRSRIDAACTLLRQGSEPISAVALACGYGDQAAFTRQFRKSVGLTPRAYRFAAHSRQPSRE